MTIGLLAGLVLGLAVTAAGAARASGPRHGASGLVGYPAFLPKSTLKVPTDTVLVGTASRSALTSEGDPVKVVTPHWSALMTVSGPEVPGEGLPYQTPATTCTWSVTVVDVKGSVPISASAFDTIDHDASTYRPALVPGQPVPPRVLKAGDTSTFELRTIEPVGEGLMRWAPLGGHIVSKWDFVVEND
jgi:hypothetical protein